MIFPLMLSVVLESPTITVLPSVSPFMCVNIYFRFSCFGTNSIINTAIVSVPKIDTFIII